MYFQIITVVTLIVAIMLIACPLLGIICQKKLLFLKHEKRFLKHECIIIINKHHQQNIHFKCSSISKIFGIFRLKKTYVGKI